jgi:outer membrane protein TolC
MAGMKPGYKPPRKPPRKPPHLLARALCGLFALLAAQPSHAATLAEALQQAWQRHPHAAALDARIAVAEAHAELADKLTPGPAAVSFGHLNDHPGRDRGKREWEVELAAPLWLPGQKRAQSAAAASQLQEIESRTAALRLELAGELRNAGWALNSARAADALAQVRRNRAQALETDVTRRYRAGDLARIDANLARGETLAAQAASLAAQSAVQQAEAVWQGLTGMAAPAHLEAEILPGIYPAGGGLNDDFVDQALTRHPQLASLASTAQVAQARLKLAQANRRDAPELALRVQRERGDRSEAYGNAIGVKLTIPFSSGPQLRRDDAAARVELNQAVAEQRLAMQRLKLAVLQTGFELETASRQLTLAQTAQALANDTLALAEKAFQLGETNLTTLLRARAAAHEANGHRQQREIARGLAVSQFKQAIGEMP